LIESIHYDLLLEKEGMVMQIKKVLFVFLIFLGFFMSGCSSKLSSATIPGASLEEKGKFYVVRFVPDKRNMHMLIADRLTMMGFNAVAGEKSDIPYNINTIVTYIDHWQWDMTMYMIDINIQFRDAKDGSLIMNGKSYRTSLVRKNPDEMIKETLEEMLKVRN
jgi:hypothetical protein